MVREEFKKIGRENLLPAGVILTGGTSKLPGAEEKAKEILKLPVEVAKPHNLFGMTDKVYDPSMSVAVGLMLYNFEESQTSGTRSASGGGWANSAGKTLRKVFKVFLP
jgi:cell division protein FtsA